MSARLHHRPIVRVAGAIAASLVMIGALSATATAASAADIPPLAVVPVATTTVIDTPTELTFGEASVLHVTVEAADSSVAAGTIALTLSGNTFGQGYRLVDGAVDIVIGGESNGVVTPDVLAAQTWQYVATFQPDDAASIAPSSSSVEVTIAKRDSETRVAVDGQPRVGQTSYLIVTVTGAEQPPALTATPRPFGNVVLYRDGVAIAEVALDATGTAAVAFTPTEEGVSQYGAVYSGEPNYAGSVATDTAVRVIAAPAVPVPPTPTPHDDGRAALANTGSEPASTLGLAALLAMAGALVLVLRTRRRLTGRSS